MPRSPRSGCRTPDPKPDALEYVTSSRRDYPPPHSQASLSGQSERYRWPQRGPHPADATTYTSTSKATHTAIVAQRALTEHARPQRPLRRDAPVNCDSPVNRAHEQLGQPDGSGHRGRPGSAADDRSPSRANEMSFTLAAPGCPNNRRKSNFNSPNAKTPRGTVMGQLLFGGEETRHTASAAVAAASSRTPEPSRALFVDATPSGTASESGRSTGGGPGAHIAASTNRTHFAPPPMPSREELEQRRARFTPQRSAAAETPRGSTYTREDLQTTQKVHFSPDRSVLGAQRDRQPKYVREPYKSTADPGHFTTSQREHFKRWL